MTDDRVPPLTYLSATDVAGALRIHYDTVTQLARRGDLRGSKRNGHWYFRPEDVDAYIEAGMNRPVDQRRRRRRWDGD